MQTESIQQDNVMLRKDMSNRNNMKTGFGAGNISQLTKNGTNICNLRW